MLIKKSKSKNKNNISSTNQSFLIYGKIVK